MKTIEEFMSEPAPDTTTTKTIYTSDGRPYTVICTVKRRCSEDPRAATENFVRVCSRIYADNLRKKAAKGVKEND